MTIFQARVSRESPPIRRPTEDEIKQAREAIHRLDQASTVRMTVPDKDGTESEIELPPLARTALEYVLAEMAAGNGMIFFPLHPLLTPFEAADLLGVSLFYLNELINNGKLPCRESGATRRIVFEDLIAYKKKTSEARSQVLDELVAEAQELGMGY